MNNAVTSTTFAVGIIIFIATFVALIVERIGRSYRRRTPRTVYVRLFNSDGILISNHMFASLDAAYNFVSYHDAGWTISTGSLMCL